MAVWKWAGDVLIGPTGLTFKSGSGDPTGVVSAKVGSIYLRTDGTSGSTLYIKESGTGTSGWAAIPSDVESSLNIKVNGVSTSLQSVLNLTSDGMTVTDAGDGEVHIATDATQIPYDNDDHDTVSLALDALFYVFPEIIDLDNDAGIMELGSTLSSLSITWSLNKTVTTLRFTAADSHLTPNSTPINLSTGATSQSFTGSYTPTSVISATWTLQANDGTHAVSASTTVDFQLKRYWGASSSTSLLSADILALSDSEFATGRLKEDTLYDCSGGKYPYFCYPSSYGDPQNVTVNGMVFSDWTSSVVLFTNASGFTTNYRVIRFNDLQHGSNINVSWG